MSGTVMSGTKIKQASFLALLVGLMLGLLAWQIVNRRIADPVSVVAGSAYGEGFSIWEIAEVVDAIAHFKGHVGEITTEDVRTADFEEQLGGYQLPDLSAYRIESIAFLTAETLTAAPAVYVSADSSGWKTGESSRSMRLLFVDPQSGFAGGYFADGVWEILELHDILSRLDSRSRELTPFQGRSVLKFSMPAP